MPKTLKGRISLIYLCLVLLISVVGITSFINLLHLSRSIDGLMTDNYKSIGAVSNMLEAVERQDSAVLIYISVDKQRGIDLFSENSNIFMKWLSVEINNVTEPGEQEIVNKINESYLNYVKFFSHIQDITNTSGEHDAISFYNQSMLPDFQNLKQTLKELSNINEEAMFNGKEMATQSSRNSTIIILALTLATIVGGFILSVFFTNRFLSPVYSLTSAMKELRAGNINKQADVYGDDEISELTREFNEMTTKLRQFEQSALGTLMNEKNKSMAIMKSISDPLIVLDNNYRIVLLNNACESFFDISEEKALNRHFLEYIRNGELFDFISGAVHQVDDTQTKIIQISSNKADYYFNVVVTTINSSTSSFSGLVILLQNVTQLKLLDKTRTDFIATISHEFKTPLTSILMGTNLMLNQGLGHLSMEQKDVVVAIQEDGERLSTLVNDLLELTKIESGNAIFHIEPCSIEAIISQSLKLFYTQADQKQVSIFFDGDNNLPRVMGDHEKISWAINNLISNSLKYTNIGDEICISAQVKDNQMLIKVWDTGAGIPEEYMDRIFDKFVQVKDGELEIRGTGLGLYVVRQIINAHRGHIWCESKLDVGSCFSFTLPIE